MTLCDGDPVAFNEIKKGTVELYLAKLDNFAIQREAQMQQSSSIPRI